MKISRVETLTVLMALVVAVATLSAPVFADASSAASGQQIAFTAAPSVNADNSSAPFLAVGYVNQSPLAMNGTMYAVFYNVIGQTVAVEATPIVGIGAGQNATAMLPLNVPLDSYTVFVFVVSPGGWALSPVANSTVVA